MSSPSSNTSNASDTSKLLRVMGIWSLALYGVGDMLGAGVYGLVGRAAGQMGNAVWVAFLASMVAALCTGLSYAEVGSRYPRAAGTAFVVHRAFDRKFISYMIGLATMVSGLTSMAAGSRVFSGYLQAALGGPEAVPLQVVIVAFVLFLTFVNFWGMRQSIWLNILCTLVEVGGLVIVVAVGARYWGSVDYLETPTVDGVVTSLGPALVLQGAVLTFYSFVGFEDMLNVTEEVKDPERTFPRAMILALVLTTVLYITISVTAVSVVPYGELATSSQPLVDVVVRAAPWFPAIAFSIISMFAVANTALLNFIMGSRLVYGMARHGLMPRPLGRVHPVRRTPHVAILTIMVLLLALALSGDVASLAKATSVLLLCVFIFVNASLIVLKRRPGEPRGGFRIPAFIPALGILVCLAMLSQAGLPELRIAGALVLGIAVLYFVIHPKQLTEADLNAID